MATPMNPAMNLTYTQPEIQDISRQRKLSEMLLQQGMQGSKGQMVGNIYVPSHPLEQIADAYAIYKSGKLSKEANTKEQELAKMLREQGVKESQDILSTLRGREAVPEFIPQGQTLLDDQGMPTYGAKRAVAAIAPDAELAFAKASGAQTKQGQALAPLVAKQFEPKWEKAKEYDPKTGNTNIITYNANSPNPEATKRVIGIESPALSAKEILDLEDRGINVRGGMPVNAPVRGNMPTAGGQGGGNQVVNMGGQAMGYNPNLSPAANREVSLDKAKRQAKFAEEAPAALEMMNQTLTNIDDLIGDTKVVNGKIVYGTKKPHEGFESSVGFSGAPLAKYISGSPVSDFRSRFDQIKDKTFLQAFETLKGSGQITEIEGAKATSALNRMSLAQSEKEFITAAREFEQNIKRGMELARQRAGMTNGWSIKR